MIEIPHGDISLVEHPKFTIGRRYEIYITRYGEGGKYYFEDMNKVSQYLKSAYDFTEDMIKKLYDGRNIAKI